MKFLINRTSDWTSNPPPCEGAVLEGKIDETLDLNEYSIEIGTIEELLALMDKVKQPLIIDRTKDGVPLIEIYDTWRE